jgi:hypothetical protein
VTGALRTRAIHAARTVAGPGPVRTVEREDDGSIEVDVLAADRTILEVELDRQLRMRGSDPFERLLDDVLCGVDELLHVVGSLRPAGSC